MCSSDLSDKKHAPANDLTSVFSPWPFHKWGVDIVGPFPLAPGQLKFLIVGVDYFTKWIEAEAVSRITADKVKKSTGRRSSAVLDFPNIL